MKPAEQWAGEFGNEYTDRNLGNVENNKQFFIRALSACKQIDSVVELGANIGDNLVALQELVPRLDVTGIEINLNAWTIMAGRLKNGTALCTPIQKWQPEKRRDLAFTKGVLIHIPPAELPAVYEKLYQASKRYILIAEYFRPHPEEIKYRGADGMMWARDFGGEMLDAYPSLKLIDVGFAYKRTTGQDNMTWWLMEKP